MNTSVDFSGKKFSGDVITLVLGATIAQGLAILASPILTRYFSPTAFGIFSIFNSISGIIAVVSCLRYEMAIVITKDEEEAANLTGLSLLLASLVSLIMVPIVWLGGPFIVSILRIPEFGPYLWLLPPITFFGGATLGHPALNNWNIRNKKFTRTAIIQVINAVVMVVIQLGAGFIGWATGGSLILGSFFGSLVSTGLLGWLVWRENGSIFKKYINKKSMLLVVKRYRKFPLYDAGAAFISAASWQLPSILLTIFFSPAIAGFYALGNRVLRAPMDFIGTAIANVFFQRSAEAKLKGNLAPVVEVVFKYLVILGLFPMLILTIIGKDLFVVIFSSKWAEAGVYTQILSVYVFVWFISSPLSNLFRVLEKQRNLLILNIFIFLARFGSLLIGGLLGNARLALGIFSITGVVLYGYMGLSIIFVSGVLKSKVVLILLKYLGIFLPCGIVLLIMEYLKVSPLLNSAASVCMLGLYYLFVLHSDSQLYGLIKEISKKFFRRINIEENSHIKDEISIRNSERVPFKNHKEKRI